MATRSSCVQRPAAAGRAVLGAAARSERVLRGVVRIEEVEVRLGQDVGVVESGARSSHLAAAAAPLADEVRRAWEPDMYMGNAESSQPPPQPGSAAKPRSWRDEAQLMGTCSPEELAAVIRGGGEGPRLLCYGDSLTAGYTMLTPYTREYEPWAPHLAKALGLQVDAVGLSGWTTQQMLDHQHSSACTDICGEPRPGLATLLGGGHRFSTVIIMAGTNDLGVAAPERIFANLKALHEVCHTAGARTVALSVPQSKAAVGGGPAFVNERRERVNALLAEFAKGHPRCTHVAIDVEVPWAADSPLWEPDGLHFSKEGYAELARKLAPRLRAIAL